MARPRKTAASVSPEQTTEQEPQEAESLSLNFVEADDIASTAEKKPSRLKKAYQQVFLTTDEEKPAKRKKKSRFWQETATPLVTGGMLWCIHLLCPDEYKEVFYVGEQAYQFLPTDKQLTDILTPLARIADRHSPDVEVNPDLLDIIACGQACALYGMELRATMILKAHIDKKAKEDQKIKELRNRFTNGTDTPYTQ